MKVPKGVVGHYNLNWSS